MSVGLGVGVYVEEFMMILIVWLCLNVLVKEISGWLVYGDFRLDNLVLSRARSNGDD